MRRGKPWVRWFWLIIVIYMMYTVGRLAYRNYQLNVEEAQLRSDIATLENDVQHLRNQIVYFQSTSYKEKMLREKLNLQKEGERVVVITEEEQAQEVEEEKKPKNTTNPEAWWDLFIGI